MMAPFSRHLVRAVLGVLEALGLRVDQIGDSSVYVLWAQDEYGHWRRVAMIRDETPWWNSFPPEPEPPPETEA